MKLIDKNSKVIWRNITRGYRCWQYHSLLDDRTECLMKNEKEIIQCCTISLYILFIHQQQPEFPSETQGCSERLWRLWRILVPSDGELHASRRTGYGSRCILTSSTLRLVYALSERHVCQTIRRGCSYALAVHTTPANVYAFLRPIATFHLSTIAIYRMPHSPLICLALRICHIMQYSLRFGYLACRCICFAIIVFYRSEIYRPIFSLSSTMP
jgi:hypothetical protein